MTRLRTSVATGLLFTLVVLAGVSGCDSGDALKAEKRPEFATPSSALEVKGEPGVFGGTLTVAIPSAPTTYNPFFLSDPGTSELLRQLYAPLVGYNPVTKEILPEAGLASSFEATGNKVTVRLRQGLVFSDEGQTPILADDVIYSIYVALDEDVKSPLADMLTVSGRKPDVRKVNDFTVELEFIDKYPAIGYVLSQLPVISAGVRKDRTIEDGGYEKALNIKTDPTKIQCSGPFKVKSVDEKARSIKLQYNNHYWKVDSQGNRLPYLDYLEFKWGLSSDDMAKGLADGTLHIAQHIDPAKFASLQNDKVITKDLGVGFGTWMLILNQRANASVDRLKATWFRQENFRQFLSRAIDRDRIVKEVFAGRGVPLFGPVSPGNEVWVNNNVTKYSFDPAQAKKLLEADRFKVGERDGKQQLVDVVNRKVSFNLFYPKDEVGERLQAIIVETLAAYAIPVKTAAVDPGKLLTDFLVASPTYEMVLWRIDGFGSDPISYLPLFMSNGTKHFYLTTGTGEVGPFEFEIEANRLMRSQQDKVLVEERQKDFSKVQELWAKATPAVSLAANNVLIAWDKRLGNFQPTTIQPYGTWNAEQIFFKR